MNTQPLPRFIVSVRRAFGNVCGRIPQGRQTRVGLFLLGTLLTLAAGLAPLPPQASKLPIPPRGFNHNGRADLAIGAPRENVGTTTDAGAVNVLYGSSPGLSSTGNQYWNQAETGILDTAEASDRFGEVLAFGNFDCDLYLDLAIGVPFEDTGTTTNNGAVNVLYGAPSGLIGGSQALYQGHESVVGTPADEDRFGHALATGDFNKDGKEDLAIGIPLKDDGATDNGGVVILSGSSAGIGSTGNQFWSQFTGNVEGIPEDSDEFGSAVAAGDFDGDGYDDLAVGVPYENQDATADVGAVNILYGSATGISAAGDQIFTQDYPGMSGTTAEAGDRFGSSLAAPRAQPIVYLPTILR